MRLIDADRFEDEMNEELLPELIKEYGKEEALKGLHFSFRDCICNIQCQPTVDAVERIEYEKMKDLAEQYKYERDVLEESQRNKVEVVRCKDCKHMKYAIDKAKNGMCGVHSALIIMNGNDYCSYGERKNDD